VPNAGPGRGRQPDKLGIVGGSGLYDLPDLQVVEERRVETPYGSPSDVLVVGRLGGREVVFLSRHGRGHRLSPTELPYRANVYAMKLLGVTHLFSLSAVGSLREEIAPLSLVVPDQIVDRTVVRPRTFFGEGAVAHVGIADPYCPELRSAVADAAGGLGPKVFAGGAYVCIEGPQFSTRAESELYRSWGAKVIGMTAMPEARLAREAELCYACLALVTDYDVWHETEADVSVELVIANLQANVVAAREVIRRLASTDLPPRFCGCQDALKNAIATDAAAIPPSTRRRLGVIADRHLPPADQT
jgi:5'-methylthioadenosine phosphorylase